MEFRGNCDFCGAGMKEEKRREEKRREEKRREEKREKREEPTVLYCVSELTESYEGNPERVGTDLFFSMRTLVNLQDAKYLVCIEIILTYIQFNEAALFQELQIIFSIYCLSLFHVLCYQLQNNCHVTAFEK